MYFNYIDFLNATAEKNGVEVGSKEYKLNYAPVKNQIEAFVGSKYPQWATRPDKVTLHKSDAFVALANHFINDKQFMSTVGKNNDAIQGLALYMKYRAIISDGFQKNAQITGYSTLEADANQQFALIKDAVAKKIISKHKGFKQMYDRYLADDELNPIPPTLSEAGK